MNVRESVTRSTITGQMTQQNKRRRRIAAAMVAAALSGSLAPRAAYATSDTWDGSSSGVWATSANWLTNPAAVPGSGDTATFSLSSATVNGNTTIDLGAGVTVAGVVFDTANAAAYTIGTGAAGSQALTLNNAGSITTNFSVSNTQIVNANLVLGTDATAQAYTMTNNSSGGITFAGGVAGGSGGTAGSKALTVAGSGLTTLNNMTPGGATGVAITKTGVGTLILGGNNTGLTSVTMPGGVNAGYLGAVRLASNGALGSGTLATTGQNLTYEWVEFTGGITIANAINSFSRDEGSPILRNLSGNNTYSGTYTANGTGGGITLDSVSGKLSVTGTLSQTVGARGLSLTGNGDGEITSAMLAANIGTVTKRGGTGTWSLSGANTYTGITTAQAGTLSVNFAAAGAPTSNIINNTANSSSLTLGGGTMNVTLSNSATANTQRFNGTLTAPGASAFRVTQNGNTNAGSGVTLGALTRNAGGTLDFTLPTTGAVTTTSTTFASGSGSVLTSAANGIAYATVDATTWATNTAGTIGALGVYQTDFSSATGDTDVTANLTPGAAVTANTLRFNSAGKTLTLNSAGTSTISTGGILVTSAGTNSLIASGGTGAAIQPGATANEVVIHNYGSLNVAVPIVNNGANPAVVTVDGNGATTFAGTNTYTSATNVAGGTLTLTGSHAGTGAFTVRTGTFNMNGTTNANIVLAPVYSRTAIANINGTVTLANGNTLTAGNAIGGNAIINIGSSATISGGNSAISAAAGGYGLINMTGGNVTPGQFLVAGITGAGAAGMWNVSGGTIQTTGNNGGTLGASNLTVGILNMSGGSFTTTGSTGLLVGENGTTGGNTSTGILNVSGTGQVNLNGSGGLNLARNRAATGIVNLGAVGAGGGTIQTNIVLQGGGNTPTPTGVFNFHGGTLKSAAAPNANFFTGLTSAFVWPEGGVIDSNGQSITIAQSLLAPTGNGVSAISTSGLPTTSYAAPPVVTLSGGGGVGATAVASVDGGGNLTGLTVTNPGTGYTSLPLVTLTGGGYAVPNFSTTAATLAANATTGGITKTGSGTLTLSGVSTYLGPTLITAGTLQMSGTGSVGGSGITINGSGAKLLQTSTSTITPPVTVTNGTIDGNSSLSVVTVASNAANTIANGNGAVDPITINNLTFSGAASLNLRTSQATQGTSKLQTVNIVTAGSNSLSLTVSSTDGWTNGAYNLISYGSLSGSGFAAFPSSANTNVVGLGIRQSKTLANGGGVISLTIAGDNPKWTGAANSTWSTGTIPNPKNWQLITGGTPTDYIDGDIVTFDDSASNFTVDINAGNVSPTNVLFPGNNDYTLNGTSGIAGTTSLNKTGGAALTINNANSYSGGTNLALGKLNINNASAIGTGVLTISATTIIDNNSGSPITLSTNNVQNWNGDFTFSGSNSLNMGTGAVTIAGGPRTVRVDGSGALAIGGNIGGNQGIVKDGNGRLELSGSANTAIGAISIRNGELAVTGGVTGTTSVDIAISPTDIGDNGTLVVSGGTVNANRVIIGGNSPNTGTPGNGALNQSGGVINSQQWFTVGSGIGNGAAGNTGVYNMTGGTLNVITQLLEVANFAGTTGTVNMSNASTFINMYNNTSIAMGSNDLAFNGTFNHNSGTIAFYSNGPVGATIGGTGQLLLGRAANLNSGFSYTYNFNGGLLIVPQIARNSAGTNLSSGIFNFNGGVLRAARANATFMQGLTSANVQGGGAIIDSNGFDITIAQPLSDGGGGGGLSKVLGSGTLTMTGVSTYSGGTDISAGTLVVSGAGEINGTSGVTVNGSGAKYVHASSVAMSKPVFVTNGTLDGVGTINNTVTVNNGATNTVANGNGGAGVLNISTLNLSGLAKLSLRVSSTSSVLNTTTLTANGGAGSVTVDAANTAAWVTGASYGLVSYSGSIGGTGFGAFTLGAVANLGPRQSATLTNPSGFIALNITGDNAQWTGRVNGNWTTNTIPSPKNWQTQFGAAQTDFLTNDTVIFDDTAAGTTNVVVSDANVSTSAVLVSNDALNYTFSGSFGISAGLLSKSGIGSLTINNANTYAGGTTMADGTLNINNVSAIGTGALTILGGTLNNTSGFAVTLNTNNAQNWNGNFGFTGSNDLNLGPSGNITLGGPGTARSVTVSGGTLSVGIMTIGTGLGLTKQGNGTLQFSTVSNATHNVLGGELVVNAGTLNIGGRDLDVTGVSGTGTIGNGSATTRWLYVTNSSNYTFAGVFQNGAGGGALGLNKNGAGTLTISGANTYTDTTTLNAGTLIISGNNSSAGTNTIVNAGNLVLANTNTLGAASLVRLVGTNVSTWTFASDGDGTPYNLTMGTGTQAAIVSDRATPGAGVNHTLATQSLNNGLGGGTLNFTSGANVTSGMGRITFTQLGLGAGSAQTTTLNPTSANVTVTGTIRKENNNVSQTIELGGTTTDNFVNGAISNGPPITGANNIALTKSNSSTWTINGANTYTGATNVTGGKLIVGNSIIGTSGLTITGSTLDMTAAGTGMIRTSALSIDGSSKLDLGRNKMIVVGGTLGTGPGGVYDGISGLVDTGRNGGNWDGSSGIITTQSNALPATNITNIAVAAAGDIGKTTFGGQAVTATDVLVMYTYNGDANLSANVDADDYFIIDSNYNKSGTVFGYSRGDFNYDGVIDGDDFALIDAGFAGQGSVPISPGAPAGVTAVPEPIGLPILALGAAGLLRRRRRGSRM